MVWFVKQIIYLSRDYALMAEQFHFLLSCVLRLASQAKIDRSRVLTAVINKPG
jgi:hypothetical protein